MKKKMILVVVMFTMLLFVAQNVFANNDIVWGQVTHETLEVIPGDCPPGGYSNDWWGLPPRVQFQLITVPSIGVGLNFQVMNPESGEWFFAGFTTTDGGGMYSFELNYNVEPIVYDILYNFGEATFRVLNDSATEVYTPEFRWSPREAVYHFDIDQGMWQNLLVNETLIKNQSSRVVREL